MMTNRFGYAAALAAALAFAGQARAQGTGSTSGSTGSSTQGSESGQTGSSGSMGGSTGSSGSSGSMGSDTSSSGARSDTSGANGSKSSYGSTGTGSTAGTDTGTMTGSASKGTQGKLGKDLRDAAQKLHAANQAEVEMGQMGASTAQDDQVKQFAQKMVDDHGKNDQQLQQLAQSMGVDLNGKAFDSKQKDAQKDMQKLHGKQGAAFDKAFMAMLVKDHEKDMKDVKKASDSARKEKQAELASFLDQTHSAMQGHLQEAKQIEKTMKGRGGQARSSSRATDTGTGSSATGGAAGSSESHTGAAAGSGGGSPGSTGSGSSGTSGPSGGASGSGGSGGAAGSTSPGGGK